MFLLIFWYSSFDIVAAFNIADEILCPLYIIAVSFENL